MKSLASFRLCAMLLLSLLILGLAGCDSAQLEQRASDTSAQSVTQKEPVAQKEAGESVAKTEAHYGDAKFNKVSLSDGEKVEETDAAIDRKIIRNAELTLEVPQTTGTQQKIVSIAEAHGGFVVTSEAKQRDSQEPAQRTLDIKLVVRIPENQ
ncbi:MAG TPA: DUF4349 domain-containing protein, partial [Pyrinomonadaceae bacterium]